MCECVTTRLCGYAFERECLCVFECMCMSAISVLERCVCEDVAVCACGCVIICEGVYVYSCMCVHECVSESE